MVQCFDISSDLSNLRLSAIRFSEKHCRVLNFVKIGPVGSEDIKMLNDDARRTTDDNP